MTYFFQKHALAKAGVNAPVRLREKSQISIIQLLFSLLTMKKTALSFLITNIITLFLPVYAHGKTPLFTVIKTGENNSEWQTIDDALYQTGVPYCITDTPFRTNSKLIFLPNVNNLTERDIQDLKYWVQQGGKIIIAGQNASKFLPLIVPETYYQANSLSMNDKSVFLTWDWGVNSNSIDQDIAWLRAGLSRYIAIPQQGSINPDRLEQPCVSSKPNMVSSIPNQNPKIEPWLETKMTGNNQQPVPIQNPEPPINNLPIIPPDPSPVQIPLVDNKEAIAINTDLQNLINRFATAILTDDNNSSAQKVLTESQNNLQEFKQLWANQEYDAAKEKIKNTKQNLLDNYPINTEIKTPEIRAIWLDRNSILNHNSPEELAKVFDTLAKAGINTVFFETVNAGYSIYPSQIAKEQNPMTMGWDPLEVAVKLAHERGIELHAWVWIFAAGNKEHNKLINFPEDYSGPVISVHKDWGNYDQNGNLFENASGKAFLDPANPEVRKYISDLLLEIATKYKVNGIQLDYIRYPFQSQAQIFGYGEAGKTTFKQLNNSEPPINDSDPILWQKWLDFKTTQVDNFVIDISQKLKNERSDLIVSAAVFAIPKISRLSKIQQHWELWGNQGYVDVFFPMTYANDANKLAELTKPLFGDNQAEKSLIIPAVRLLNIPVVNAVDQLQLIRNLPTGGYSLFAFDGLDENLQKVFIKSQGKIKVIPSEIIPYRQPFRSALKRLEVLKKQWNLRAKNSEIWMIESDVKEWNKQTNTLEEVLKELALNPSSQNLTLAQEKMTNFRLQFRQWTMFEKIKQSYQVQVWDNQLETIERLLKYGERLIVKK
jgi:uncharacterized lipoprotein YddW (UPF0748 family)